MGPWFRMVRKFLGLLLLGLGTLVFLWGAFDSWMLRDGLGPDSVESHGLEAAYRFVKDFSEFLYISIGFWVAGWYLLRRSF
ncbi:MAG: hypothetical protein QOC61_1458 [Acidobacteriota bacterium]|nr:hypothetical protein [Acidobacteriota bacterium]